MTAPFRLPLEKTHQEFILTFLQNIEDQTAISLVYNKLFITTGRKKFTAVLPLAHEFSYSGKIPLYGSEDVLKFFQEHHFETISISMDERFLSFYTEGEALRSERVQSFVPEKWLDPVLTMPAVLSFDLSREQIDVIIQKFHNIYPPEELRHEHRKAQWIPTFLNKFFISFTRESIKINDDLFYYEIRDLNNHTHHVDIFHNKRMGIAFFFLLLFPGDYNVRVCLAGDHSQAYLILQHKTQPFCYIAFNDLIIDVGEEVRHMKLNQE
ncbi:MAG: hypothetical protein HQM12_02380 [SAR324 cluster bacterium]|nr:hypothetical protein [SAR324 cluster bacterium]